MLRHITRPLSVWHTPPKRTIVGFALLGCASAVAACGDVSTPPEYTTRAVVYGTAFHGTAPLTGRRIVVLAYRTTCTGPLVGQGSTLVDAQGRYHALVTSVEQEGAKCVATLVPSASGADTLRDIASVVFRARDPIDSVLRNLVRQTP